MACASTYNQFLDEHSLADTSTPEETNLTTTSVWSKQIDDLDTSNENLSGRRLLNELWCIGVDGQSLGGLDRTTLINWITSDIHDTAESAWTNGNHDGVTGIRDDATTDKTFGTCCCQELAVGVMNVMGRSTYRP